MKRSQVSTTVLDGNVVVTYVYEGNFFELVSAETAIIGLMCLNYNILKLKTVYLVKETFKENEEEDMEDFELQIHAIISS